MERTLATALAQFFEAELGATEQEGAQGVGKEESLVYSLVFDRIEEFFADDPASPCKQLLCQNMESSLLDWRGKSRKAIDCNALLAAVDRAFDACIDEEQRLFCATGPGNVPGPKTGAINSRRTFRPRGGGGQAADARSEVSKRQLRHPRKRAAGLGRERCRRNRLLRGPAQARTPPARRTLPAPPRRQAATKMPNASARCTSSKGRSRRRTPWKRQGNSATPASPSTAACRLSGATCWSSGGTPASR